MVRDTRFGNANDAVAPAAGTAAFGVRRLASFLLAAALAVCGSLSMFGCSGTEGSVPELKPAELSSPAIGEDGKLRVGVNSDNSPLAGKSGDRIIGIDVDIAAALGDELGLQVEIVDVGADGAKAIEEDEVDVVLGVESGSSEDGCWISNQYLQTGIVLFESEGSNAGAPSPTSSPEIAAQVSSKSAWAVTNIFGDESLAAATDLAAAFNSLGDGEVEYVASDAVIGLYAANRQDVDVEVCALLESPTGYCALVAESNNELQQAIGDALTTIKDNGVIDVIENKWLGQVIDLAGISKIEGEKAQSTNANKPTDEEGEDSEEVVEGDEKTDSSKASSSSSASSSAKSSAA